jgi:hypothetical protein
MNIDSEFSQIIPPLAEDEYAELEKSILAEGCRDALVTWGDTLIDGHNRYAICRRHGIPYHTVHMEFENRNEAIAWIIRNQIARRNLTREQRRELIQRQLKMTPEKSDRQIADGLGVSHTTVSAQRSQLESTGQIGQLNKTVGADGKERPRHTAYSVPSPTIDEMIESVEAHAPDVILNGMKERRITPENAYNLMNEFNTLPPEQRAYKAYWLGERIKERAQMPDPAEAVEESKRDKRFKDLCDLWFKFSYMDCEKDFDIWLSGIFDRSKRDDQAIDNEIIRVDRAIEVVQEWKNRFIRAVEEHRKLRIV